MEAWNLLTLFQLARPQWAVILDQSNTSEEFAMQDLKALLDEPEDKYMDEHQLAAFKGVLLSRQHELRDRLKQRQEDIAARVVTPDEADMSALEEERSLNLRFIAREQDELKQIAAALERIEDESFGWCVLTGEPIGLKRLIHTPTALRSFDAQALVEQKNRNMASGMAI
ncbi:hypothetical protein APA27_23760 [Pseudomonas aeruginosa]|jgi:DnaK suppressor protein|nr:hypothetical protein APA27_23760 [Pseudomonas aeruginosa]KSM58744.1 hypothetical protein APA74_22065 [Pseudomonas aeruginosa]KSO58494.1 hypothetical protein APA97_19220 [Pseudomonas aeruginosa]